MIENLSITRLKEKDFEDTYKVFKETIPYALNVCNFEEDEEAKALISDKKEMLNKAISKGEPVFFTAKLNNKVIGTISYGPCSEDIKICTNNKITDLGEMGSLFILPEYQNRGIGSALISYLIEYLKEIGVKEFCLDSGYKKAQQKWIKKFGEPYVVVKDYWMTGVDNMVWKCKVN